MGLIAGFFSKTDYDAYTDGKKRLLNCAPFANWPYYSLIDEAQAEVIYAMCHLILQVLTFLHEQSFAGLIKAALIFRTCNNGYR